MHLDFEGREIMVSVLGESTVHPPRSETVRERIRVGLSAIGSDEYHKLLKTLGRARRKGINSTDGHGRVLNTWRVIDTAAEKKPGGMEDFNLVLDLEEMR